MYNLTKLKILVIGPEACGKTTLVNYLAEKQNVLENPYRPTTGVRIVEHETYVDNRLVSIEFWDVSGKFIVMQEVLKMREFGQLFKSKLKELSLSSMAIIQNQRVMLISGSKSSPKL